VSDGHGRRLRRRARPELRPAIHSAG
jgi:hypothetical protein